MNPPNLKNHLNLMFLMFHWFPKFDSILKNPPNLKNHLNLMFLKYLKFVMLLKLLQLLMNHLYLKYR